MCFCTPSIRTPFCPNCNVAMFERIMELTTERDELLEALVDQVKEAKRCKEIMLREAGIGLIDEITLANSEAAIAKVKGGIALKV